MSAVFLVSWVIDRRYNFIVQRLRLKTPAVATWTSRIGPITAEQHTHVHFVNLRLGPPEKSAHTVPAIVIGIVVAITLSPFAGGNDGSFAFNDELLISFRQFLEWNVDVDLFAGRGAEQIFLRFAEFLAAKNAHRALLDRQRPVRNRLVQIDSNRAPELDTLSKRAERIIETEKTWRRLAN